MPVKVIENLWIHVRDGTRLSARIWLPESAQVRPVGVVLEATPYSKRTGTRENDTAWAASFCPHGFAYARLDLRGTGESEGLLRDEYLAQEQQDIVDVIAFLAEQPWCNGSVGMRGYSWGGFAALQVAALKPPALKAIVTACSVDDRYVGDAHYVGGILGLSGVMWGNVFRTVMARAPDPALVGERWRDIWLDRVTNVPAITARWIGHGNDDAFWRHGSVAADYAAITCGVYAVGGLADAYAPTVPRLLEHLTAPRKGLVGPWAHSFPQDGNPGPGLDWVVEEIRWWDYWLHGRQNGIMLEPMLRAYIGHRTASEVWPEDTPGRWVEEKHWPSADNVGKRWFLNADGLALEAAPHAKRLIEPHQTVGISKPAWLPFDMDRDLPRDQSHDDSRSLCFDSPPLEAPMEVLGLGEVHLRLSADRPGAKVVVRLNEIRPDGKSWSIGYGVLNLAQRVSRSRPTALEPGQDYDVVVPLSYIAHRFRTGSKLRVAISESLWPMVAPSSHPVILTVETGASFLRLPVRRDTAAQPVQIPPMLRDRQLPHDFSVGTAIHSDRAPLRPDENGRVTMATDYPATSVLLPDIATERIDQSSTEVTIDDDDPSSSVWYIRHSVGHVRGDWNYTIASTTEVKHRSDAFHVTETITALVHGQPIFEKTDTHRIRRRFS